MSPYQCIPCIILKLFMCVYKHNIVFQELFGEVEKKFGYEKLSNCIFVLILFTSRIEFNVKKILIENYMFSRKKKNK